MKKLAIAGASAVLAALPVVGVFAADFNPIVDTVKVTINDSCAMSAAASGGEAGQTGGVYAKTVDAGTLINPSDWAGGSAGGSSTSAKTYTFSCNNQGGWKVTAQGVSSTDTATATAQTNMVGANGKNIATGTATSGPTSNWAFNVTATGATVVSGYDGAAATPDWALVPATATTIIQSVNNAPVSEATFTPAYRVWVSATQEADTYTGYVKYVLTAPLS